jgi:acylphosphatase
MKAGYRGTVKNLSNGTVEVYAELLDDEMQGFLELLREGSPASEVKDISYEAAGNIRLEYDGFVIIR